MSSGSGNCYPVSPEDEGTSKDCLYLYVWRIQGCKETPVIVFFHGNSVDKQGNFAAGSGLEDSLQRGSAGEERGRCSYSRLPLARVRLQRSS